MTMRHALWCGVLLLAVPSFGQPPAQEPLRVVPVLLAGPEDQKAISAMFAQFAGAWNAGDSDRLGELFVPERGQIRSDTDTFDGRDRVRDFFAGALRGRFQGSRLTITAARPRMVSRADAVVTVSYELATATGPTVRGQFESFVSRNGHDGPWGLLQFSGDSFAGKTLAELRAVPRLPVTQSAVRALPVVPGQALRVGGNIREPKKLLDVRPDYPDEAKRQRVSGVVILECTIGPNGDVTSVKVLRGIPLLDQAAVDAVSQWRYEPTLVNSVPVAVIMTVTVNFQLG
jgi:uncharacterized protein (TIGR02246 family)